MTNSRSYSFIAFGLLLFAGCSSTQSEQGKLDRAMKLMNARQYGDAITILDQVHQADPGNREASLWLAEAHLGASGFEMFEFLGRVMATQPAGATSQTELREPPNCPTGTLDKIDGADFRCLIIRTLRQLPVADDPHFSTAQMLLRNTYPVAAQTPLDVNFLSAFVEVASALSRVNALLALAAPLALKHADQLTPADFPFGPLFHHFKKFFTEIREGFVRAKYSYSKIGKYVVQVDGKPLIKVGDQALIFDDSIGIPAILRFSINVLQDNARAINGELDRSAAAGLSNLGSGLVDILHAVDIAQFRGDGSRDLIVAWQFEKGINQLLHAISDGSESAKDVDLITALWTDPPSLIKNLGDAFSKGWQNEQGAPILAYFENTRAQWAELEAIQLDWDTWLNQTITAEQKQGLLLFLQATHKTDPDFGGPSGNIDINSISQWEPKFAAAAFKALNTALQTPNQVLPAFKAEQSQAGIRLLTRTKDWLAGNLW